LLNLNHWEDLIEDLSLHRKTTTTDLDHNKSSGSGLRSLRSQVEVEI
jgi:hypothetical protein